MDQELEQLGATCDRLPTAAKTIVLGRSRLPALTLGLIVALALIAGFAYFLYFRPTYESDSPSYIVPAENLLKGRGFVAWNSYPETSRTPGYPLLILPFLWAGLDLKYLVILQHLLRVALILGVSVFAFSLSGSRRLALLAAAYLCIDLPLLAAANSVLTEMFFTTIFCLGVWLLWRDTHLVERPWPWSLAYGLSFGATALIRPISLFFFIPAALYILLVRSTYRWRAALSFIVAFAVMPVLWAGRNYYETGYFTVSSVSGFNLLFYRAAGVLAIEQPGDFSVNFQRQVKELQVRACAELGTSTYGNECAGVPFTVASQHFAHMARPIIEKHPVAYARLAARGAAVMMLSGDATSLQRITGLNPHLGVRVLLLYTAPILCLALAGFVRFWRENRRFFWLAFLVIGYFVVISAGAEAYSRLRVPIIPIYAVLVAAGLDAAWPSFLGAPVRRFCGRKSQSCGDCD